MFNLRRGANLLSWRKIFGQLGANFISANIGQCWCKVCFVGANLEECNYFLVTARRVILAFIYFTFFFTIATKNEFLYMYFQFKIHRVFNAFCNYFVFWIISQLMWHYHNNDIYFANTFFYVNFISVVPH